MTHFAKDIFRHLAPYDDSSIWHQRLYKEAEFEADFNSIGNVSLKKRVKHYSFKFLSDNFSATSSTVSKPASYSAFFNTRAQCLLTFLWKGPLGTSC
jgi:hypothetical protein